MLDIEPCIHVQAVSAKAALRSSGGAQQRGRGRPPGKRLSFRRAAIEGGAGTAEEKSEALAGSSTASEAEGANASTRAAKVTKCAAANGLACFLA